MSMKLTILGSGTSCGVPQVGCDCDVCISADQKDKRLRCSSVLDVEGKRVLIDCSPDFREQMLNIDFKPLDAVLITHEHYDHVGGLDDLRPYSIFGDVDVYAEKFCADHLIERIPYCFTPKDKRYPGVPAINLMHIEPHVPIVLSDREPMDIDDNMLDESLRQKRQSVIDEMHRQKASQPDGRNKDVVVMPIRVMHGKLPIVGFRIDKLAYITDMSTIPDSEYEFLEGIDTLVVNGLRHKSHPSHQTIEEAVEFAKRVGARQTYFIHMSHHILPHEQEQKHITETYGEGYHLAYDGLEIVVE